MSKYYGKSKKRKKSKNNDSRKQKDQAKLYNNDQAHSLMPEIKNQETAEKKSWRYLLLSLAVSSLTIGVFALAVFSPKGVSNISIILAILSVVALISAKTPIGNLINKISWIHSNQIDHFFDFYKRGLILFAKNAIFVVIIFSLNFFYPLIFINHLVTTFITCILVFFIYLFYTKPEPKHVIFNSLAIVSSILMLYGVILVSTKAFEQEALDSSYYEVKKEPLIVNNLSAKASDVKEFRQLFELTFRLDIHTNRVKFLADDKNKKPDLWVSPNWASETAHYIITSETVRLCKDQGIPTTNFDTVRGKRFNGADEFLENISQLLQREIIPEFQQKLLKSSLSDEYLRSENEFRETWQEIKIVFSEDEVQSVKEVIEKKFNNKSKSVTPLYFRPDYLSNIVLESSLYNLSCLAVVVNIIYNRVGIAIFNNYYPIVLVLGLILFLILSDLIAKRLEKYNQKYDPQSNNPSWRFFALTAVFGLIVAYYTY